MGIWAICRVRPSRGDVGLEDILTTIATGSESGGFIVTLQHQPPVDGTPVKTNTSGIDDGDTDIQVAFDLTVN